MRAQVEMSRDEVKYFLCDFSKYRSDKNKIYGTI